MKGYARSTKINRNKIRPKGVKLNHKHKIINDKSIRASSGSNRKKFNKDREHLNKTGSKFAKDKDKYHHILHELAGQETNKMPHAPQEDLKMPMVGKGRPTNGIYSSFKSTETKEQHLAGIGIQKDSMGYNHFQINNKGANRGSILQTKLEMRTNPDSNDNEYRNF